MKATFDITDEQLFAMKLRKATTGVPVSEQVRRAIAASLKRGDYLPQTPAKPHPVTRGVTKRVALKNKK